LPVALPDAVCVDQVPTGVTSVAATEIDTAATTYATDMQDLAVRRVHG
jgi:hypothetical protein